MFLMLAVEPFPRAVYVRGEMREGGKHKLDGKVAVPTCISKWISA
jgi:hypothetical protein